jgi:hypothetical protein
MVRQERSRNDAIGLMVGPHTGNVISYCVMMSEQYHDDDECSYWTQGYSNDGVAYEMVDGMRCRTERE